MKLVCVLHALTLSVRHTCSYILLPIAKFREASSLVKLQQPSGYTVMNGFPT